jgi:hypothetical protein
MPDANHAAEVQACIVDCLECYSLCRQQAMNHCLEAGGRHVDPEHSRLMKDCAEICHTAADFMLSSSAFSAKICALCAEICEACAESCEDIGGMDDCARACRGCARSCRRIAITGTGAALALA